jgi:transmembrane sensor
LEQQTLKSLISKYNSGTVTAEEKLLVERWYESVNGDDSILDAQQLLQLKQSTYKELLGYIDARRRVMGRKPHQSSFAYIRWIAAAAILLICSIGIYYHYSTAPTDGLVKNILKNDIAPGGNKATLTLADGSRIILDDAKNGKITKQGETLVQKKRSGLLSYVKGDVNLAGTEITYNTVSTPRGGQYDVTLADGTKIWLNAASSIKFPTSFTGKERNVELTGEAYFEVAENKAMPFHVSVAGQTIEVLGTHFNVNAYTDEAAVKTTLLKGSVKVTGGGSQAIIKPGQQALFNASAGNPSVTVTDGVDTDEVIAWKNGSFYFNNADIQTVMRQISRWYNVDIEYAGKIPDDHFSGKFSKNMNASNALRLLEFTGVNFKIEGRKIIVK